MGQERKNSDRLNNLESELHDLAPAPAHMDTAQTMYLAGQQSVRRQQRWQMFWPLSSACLAITCVTLSVLLARPSELRPSELRPSELRPSELRIVYVPVQEEAVEDSMDQAEPKNEEQPVAPKKRSNSSRRQLASVQPTVTRWHDLMEQVLNGASDSDSMDLTSEPAIIETVYCSDWPTMLTDQSVGERFRSLTEPMPPATAIQYWTTIFPKRG